MTLRLWLQIMVTAFPLVRVRLYTFRNTTCRETCKLGFPLFKIYIFFECDWYSFIVFFLTNKNFTLQLCQYLQSLISSVLKTAVLPYLNHQLKSLPLPNVDGYGFQNTVILYNYPWISVCSDFSFTEDDYYFTQHSNYVS